MDLIICGGGTGGHIYPGLAMARYIMKRDSCSRILFVGTARGLENKIVPKAGFDLYTMPVRALSNSSLKEKPNAVASLFKSVAEAFKVIKDFKPEAVLGTGGYAAGPMLLASRLKGLPVILHEQNAIPGRTNRLMAPWATRVCITFKKSEKYFRTNKILLTGNPRASEVTQLSRSEGLKRLNLSSSTRKLLLIFGGSQGARIINEVVTDVILKDEFPKDVHVFYITGNLYYDKVTADLKDKDTSNITILPYYEDMPAALSAADLVICRAGATALAELTAGGVPAILVPSVNVAYNHQYYNALILEEKGAAKIMSEDCFNAENLKETINGLISDDQALASMAAKSYELGMRDACERLFDCIEKEIAVNMEKNK